MDRGPPAVIEGDYIYWRDRALAAEQRAERFLELLERTAPETGKPSYEIEVVQGGGVILLHESYAGEFLEWSFAFDPAQLLELGRGFPMVLRLRRWVEE